MNFVVCIRRAPYAPLAARPRRKGEIRSPLADRLVASPPTWQPAALTAEDPAAAIKVEEHRGGRRQHRDPDHRIAVPPMQLRHIQRFAAVMPIEIHSIDADDER